MKKNDNQIVYISLDDSGKLSPKEKYLVYGGLYFTDRLELEKFKREYKSIRNDIWKKDCYKDVNELKGHTLKNKDRLRLLRFINRFNKLALVVDNSEIEKNEILINKDAKGRYRDYAIKLLIKELFKKLISENRLDYKKKVVLIINMDQESSKSNGKYNLKDGIIEELTKGIVNFNYSFKTKPILFGGLDIRIYSQNSKESIVIQASDLVANYVWRNRINNIDVNNINLLKRFP